MKLGVNQYPHAFDRTHTVTALVEGYGGRTGEELTAERIETRAAGRILAIRSFGKANFLVISDGVSKSYRDDAALETAMRELRRRAHHDWEGALAALPPWLKLLSELGSGDDSTACLAVRTAGRATIEEETDHV